MKSSSKKEDIKLAKAASRFASAMLRSMERDNREKKTKVVANQPNDK